MAAVERCQCCGQTIKAARPTKAAAGPIAVAEMTTAQLYTHYKTIAPAADCAFVVGIFPELAAMVPAVPTKADARKLFDAARHLLTPQPVIDEAAFWSHHRRVNSKAGRAA